MTRMTPDKAGERILQAEEKIAELHKAMHEANLLLSDMKQVARDMNQIRRDIDQRFDRAFDDHVETQIANKLAEYRESIDTAIEGATQAVYDRFDQISKMLLGETRDIKRKGKLSIPEMVREKAIRDRANYLQSIGPDEYPTGYYMDLAEETLIKEGKIE